MCACFNFRLQPFVGPSKTVLFFPKKKKIACHRLKTEFINTIQHHGLAIIKAQKASSAFFAASAACDHIRDWVFGTPKVDSLSSQIAFDHVELFCFYNLL